MVVLMPIPYAAAVPLVAVASTSRITCTWRGWPGGPSWPCGHRDAWACSVAHTSVIHHLDAEHHAVCDPLVDLPLHHVLALPCQAADGAIARAAGCFDLDPSHAGRAPGLPTVVVGE